MSQQNNFRPKVHSNSLRDYKVRWTAEPQEGAVVKYDRPQEPTLSISVVDNQPRFTVYTNIEGDKNNGKIEGNMDAFTFSAVMAALKTVAENPDFKGAYEFENKGYFFGPQGRSEKPGVLSTTLVGRDGEGVVFLALKSGKRPNIKFSIRPSNWHSLKRNGEELSRAEVSSIYALGQANLLTKLVAQIIHDEHKSYEEIKERKEKNRQSRQGGGGGGYGGNGGNNSYSKPKAPEANKDFDDDIPW